MNNPEIREFSASVLGIRLLERVAIISANIDGAKLHLEIPQFVCPPSLRKGDIIKIKEETGIDYKNLSIKILSRDTNPS